ncbi:MAG: DUF2817 domain-containing protein [Bradymonadales bacterium]|nr:MAG: DUF2817 domain-containing protein [Bradymonadales bacterium]
MQYFLVGHSTEFLPIDAYRFGPSTGAGLLVLGGVHGNEPEGTELAEMLRAELMKSFDFPFPVLLIPRFNPEGLSRGSRLNSRGVDLNRNLPTKDWQASAFSPKYPPGECPASEPETKALLRLFEAQEVFAAMSLHSFGRPLMNTNGDCELWARAIQECNDYAIEESMGYPTPGCLGTYLGIERARPTITYELRRGMPIQEIREQHLPAMMAALEYWKGKQ